jgi:hypothetical protein
MHRLQLIQVTSNILALQFGNLVLQQLVEHLALTLPLGLHLPMVLEVQLQQALHHLLDIFYLIS